MRGTKARRLRRERAAAPAVTNDMKETLARRHHQKNRELQKVKQEFSERVSVMREDLGNKIEAINQRFEVDRKKIIEEGSSS